MSILILMCLTMKKLFQSIPPSYILTTILIITSDMSYIEIQITYSEVNCTEPNQLHQTVL